MNELNKAKQRLHTGGYTCVLYSRERTECSTLRGVKPLVAWYATGESYAGFFAADKVVGKATAFLYVLLGVRAVYADVMSTSALEVLQGAGIDTEYGTLVAHIINRTGDGICPFEAAVLDVRCAQNAYGVIRAKMDELHIIL